MTVREEIEQEYKEVMEDPSWSKKPDARDFVVRKRTMHETFCKGEMSRSLRGARRLRIRPNGSDECTINRVFEQNIAENLSVKLAMSIRSVAILREFTYLYVNHLGTEEFMLAIPSEYVVCRIRPGGYHKDDDSVVREFDYSSPEWTKSREELAKYWKDENFLQCRLIFTIDLDAIRESEDWSMFWLTVAKSKLEWVKFLDVDKRIASKIKGK